jgi:hypothetical protein
VWVGLDESPFGAGWDARTPAKLWEAVCDTTMINTSFCKTTDHTGCSVHEEHTAKDRRIWPQQQPLPPKYNPAIGWRRDMLLVEHRKKTQNK